MGVIKLKLKREQYSSTAVDNAIDRTFSDFEQSNTQRDIKRLFNLYNEVYFDVPKQGDESHTTLFVKSRDFIRDFVDPKDAEIFSLTEEITDLNQQILDLQIELVSGSFTQDIESIPTEEDFDVDEFLPEMLDENNDGIDDLTQSFSSYGTPRRLILEPSNENLRNILSNPNNNYYKDEFYGKQIYKFKKKVDGEKNRTIVYEGSKGKTGKRFIFDINNGKSYKIAKRK